MFLEGKIKYLSEFAGPLGFEARKLELERDIENASMELREQEGICENITAELEKITSEIIRIETRLDSAPVQKVIDVEEEQKKVDKYTKELEAIRENNKSLEEIVVLNEGVISKIDEFMKTFDYNSWKEKETEVNQIELQLNENRMKIADLERELKTVSENKLLLQQVPCGDKFPNCKFIKHAHTALSNEKKLLKDKKTADAEALDLEDQVQELDPMTIERYLQQHEQLVGKRREKQDEISKFELQIAQNKTTIVKIRDFRNQAQESIRIFEENEKTILEFAKLTRERGELINKKSSLKKELEKCSEHSKKLSKRQGNFERELNDISIQELDLARFQKEYSAYDLYKKAMGSNGVSLDIIKKELPIINDEIAKILANVVNFEVFLENEGSALKVLIKHPSFEPRPLEMGSGAEKTIAAMAIRLAFINVSSLPIGDIFILDEPGTALDEENMEGFIRILDLVKSHFKNVILISHLDSLKDAVDLQISIEKKDKFAFVNQ